MSQRDKKAGCVILVGKSEFIQNTYSPWNDIGAGVIIAQSWSVRHARSQQSSWLVA